MCIFATRHRRGLAFLMVAFFLMATLSASMLYDGAQNTQLSPYATHAHHSNLVHSHLDISFKVTVQDALIFDPREQFFVIVSEYRFSFPEAPLSLLDPPPEAV